jgi:hypothetical protein
MHVYTNINVWPLTRVSTLPTAMTIAAIHCMRSIHLQTSCHTARNLLFIRRVVFPKFLLQYRTKNSHGHTLACKPQRQTSTECRTQTGTSSTRLHRLLLSLTAYADYEAAHKNRGKTIPEPGEGWQDIPRHRCWPGIHPWDLRASK